MNRRLFILAPLIVIAAAVATVILYHGSGVPDPTWLSPHYRLGDIVVAPVPLAGNDAKVVNSLTGAYAWKFVVEQYDPTKPLFAQLVTRNSLGQIRPLGAGPFVPATKHAQPHFVYVSYLPIGSDAGTTACPYAQTSIQCDGATLRDFRIKNPAYGTRMFRYSGPIARYDDSVAVFRADFSKGMSANGTPGAHYIDICLRVANNLTFPPKGPAGNAWLPAPTVASDSLGSTQVGKTVRAAGLSGKLRVAK